NMGTGLKSLGRLDDAAACYRTVLKLKPEDSGALWNLSTLMLLEGDYGRGWPGYEWRWKTGQLPVNEYGKPRWNGEAVEGKTVLVHAEQGLGDTLQFVRYLKMVKERGARVAFECQKPLVELLSVRA